MADGNLFPEVPQDLSKLSADELEQLRADSLAAKDKIVAEDAEFLGDRSGAQIIAEFQAGVEELERVKDQLAVLAEAEEAYVAQKTELAARADAAAPKDEEPEPEAETDEEVETTETEAEGEKPTLELVADEAAAVEESAAAIAEDLEQIAASAEKSEVRRPLPAASRRHKPQPSEPEGTAFVASAGIDGVREGERLPDRIAIAKAIIAKRQRIGTSPAGVQEDVVVASAKYAYPEDRFLRGNSDDQAKIEAVVGEQAIVASGGFCAPVTPLYDIPNVAVADRPVRDSLPGFQAVRGGISHSAAPTIGDVTTAISTITAAQDAAGGSPGTKTCQRIACPAFTTTYIEAIAHCIEVGNLGARAWPEQVAQFVDLVMAAHARVAETKLLDGIAAASTAVTAATVNNGAVNTLLGNILEEAARMRSAYRMRDGVRLRAIFPAWVADLLVLDIVRGQFDRFSRDRNGVRGLLAMFGIDAVFTLDGATSAGQVLAKQAAGALVHLPTSLVWYLFPEGTFLFLDGGTLDLGLVRDSVLNATNDYMLFGEVFENVAFVGVQSLAITTTICPSGAVTAPGTAVAC